MPKTNSIKKDLIITLSFLIAIVLVAIRLAGFLYSRHQAQEKFDAHLIKSATLVFSLIEHEVYDEKDIVFFHNLNPALQQKIFHRYEYKIHIQAWSDDEMIYNSDPAIFNNTESKYEGFRDLMINNEKWRSFSFYDTKTKIRVIISEEDLIKNALLFDVLSSFLIPLILSFALLLIIITKTVNRKLKPLTQLARQIEKMSADTLKQLQNSSFPHELKPFITSFNSLMTRLGESINAERNFTDYAAHELKTPLAIISVQAHLLISNKDKKLEQKYSQDLLDGISRATHLINQLSTLSRLESDNNNIEKEKFDLAELTKNICDDYLKTYKENDVEIELIFKAKPPQTLIKANKIYIEVMLRNLIDNAVKYRTPESKITIAIAEKNHLLSFRISNFGKEILPQEIKKIFDNFYRINKVDVKNNNGCGLGLAIAKKICHIHLAKISFESKDMLNSVEVIFPKS